MEKGVLITKSQDIFRVEVLKFDLLYSPSTRPDSFGKGIFMVLFIHHVYTKHRFIIMYEFNDHDKHIKTKATFAKIMETSKYTM